jgi:hypothetical protein
MADLEEWMMPADDAVPDNSGASPDPATGPPALDHVATFAVGQRRRSMVVGGR